MAEEEGVRGAGIMEWDVGGISYKENYVRIKEGARAGWGSHININLISYLPDAGG
jgi:hypothetical protein